MEIQLKQRLVGIAVIFSLAVIFLPMLLDGSGHRPQNLDISIPPPPQLYSDVRVEEKVIQLKKQAAELDQLKPFIVDEMSDPPDKKGSSEKAENQGKTEKTVTPKASESAHPKIKTAAEKKVSKVQVGGDLWVIQVGSFKDKNKAYIERDRLRKLNMSAVFIEKYKTSKSLNYRVRMGPFLTRNKATVVKNKVLAKLNLKGLVMKYEK